MKILMLIFGFIVTSLSFSSFCYSDSLNLAIQGISTKTAIVNGQILEIGDEVDGAKLTEINGDSVKFQYEGQTIVKKAGEGVQVNKYSEKEELEAYRRRMQQTKEVARDSDVRQQQYKTRKVNEERQQQERIAEIAREKQERWEKFCDERDRKEAEFQKERATIQKAKQEVFKDLRDAMRGAAQSIRR